MYYNSTLLLYKIMNEKMEEKFEQMNELMNSPKFKSNDLLEMAFDCDSESKAIKLAKQALEIYPDNIDAENFSCILTIRHL